MKLEFLVWKKVGKPKVRSAKCEMRRKTEPIKWLLTVRNLNIGAARISYFALAPLL